MVLVSPENGVIRRGISESDYPEFNVESCANPGALVVLRAHGKSLPETTRLMMVIKTIYVSRRIDYDGADCH